MRTTGGADSTAAMRSRSSRPSRPGIFTSVSTRAGASGSDSRRARASVPDLAVQTSKPSYCRVISRVCRMSASSSTTRMALRAPGRAALVRSPMALLCPIHRFDPRARSAEPTAEADRGSRPGEQIRGADLRGRPATPSPPPGGGAGSWAASVPSPAQRAGGRALGRWATARQLTALRSPPREGRPGQARALPAKFR